MTEASNSAGQTVPGARVFSFPGRTLLTRREAARYLGITPRRLRFLELARCGPAPLATNQYRVDALDVYRTELFLRAGLPAEEADRRASRRADHGAVRGTTDVDPFMNMATLHDLRDVATFVGGRLAILGGMLVVVLSHTPLSRILSHTLR